MLTMTTLKMMNSKGTQCGFCKGTKEVFALYGLTKVPCPVCRPTLTTTTTQILKPIMADTVKTLKITRKMMNELIKATRGTSQPITLTYYSADAANFSSGSVRRIFEAMNNRLNQITIADFSDEAKRKKLIKEAIDTSVEETIKTGTYVVLDCKEAKRVTKETGYTLFGICNDKNDNAKLYDDFASSDRIRTFSCNQVIKAVIGGITYIRK